MVWEQVYGSLNLFHYSGGNRLSELQRWRPLDSTLGGYTHAWAHPWEFPWVQTLPYSTGWPWTHTWVQPCTPHGYTHVYKQGYIPMGRPWLGFGLGDDSASQAIGPASMPAVLDAWRPSMCTGCVAPDAMRMTGEGLWHWHQDDSLLQG